MVFRSHSFLLILLVLSTPVDDIVAAGTPDPEDDILATENNNFVPAVREGRGRPITDEETPLHGSNDQAIDCSAVTPTTFRLRNSNCFPWLGADLLYFFMSVQC
jgi:hypothetical protein